MDIKDLKPKDILHFGVDSSPKLIKTTFKEFKKTYLNPIIEEFKVDGVRCDYKKAWKIFRYELMDEVPWGGNTIFLVERKKGLELITGFN